MALTYNYGLAFGDVKVPGHDSSEIGSSTEPLATGDLTTLLDEGTGQINTLLERSGITPSASMDGDTIAAVKGAILAYAQAGALRILGDTGPNYEAAWSAWMTQYENYAAHPENLGNAYKDGTTSEIDNITDGTAITKVGNDEFDFIGFNAKVF